VSSIGQKPKQLNIFKKTVADTGQGVIFPENPLILTTNGGAGGMPATTVSRINA
jgi:hypothetical protein